MLKPQVFIRLGCFAAALWYFLASSNLAASAVDNIFTRHKTVNPSASSCALHGCGCKHSKESQKGCCCSPKITPTKVCALHNHSSSRNEPPRRVKMDFLSVARCKGHLGENAVLLSHLDPHFPPVTTGVINEVSPQALYVLPKSVPYNLFSQPPEKVPLNLLVVFPIF